MRRGTKQRVNPVEPWSELVEKAREGYTQIKIVLMSTGSAKNATGQVELMGDPLPGVVSAVEHLEAQQ